MTDTSELYRLMCLTPEIQKHEWQEGDWRFNMATGATLTTTHTDIKLGVYKSNEFLPDIRWFLERIENAKRLICEYDGKYRAEWHVNEPYRKWMGTPELSSLEIALIRVFMYASHGKEWDAERKEWVKR